MVPDKFIGSGVRAVSALIVSVFLIQGCLSVNYTPLDQYPFYGTAQAEIKKFKQDIDLSGPLWSGAAKVEITPPVGLPLAGYGGRTSVGIHHPVFARALVLSNGQSTVVLLSADLLAITDDLMRAVTGRLEESLSIPTDHIMIAATHTHSGPGALARRFWERLAAGRFDPDYFELTVNRMVKAVEKARENLKPSELSFLRFDAPDLIGNRIDKKNGPTDPEVQVLMLRALDGSATSYLVNFSAHPTILRRSNRLVSGDFPGFLSQALENREGVVALYTSGAVADQRARSPDGEDMYERAERMGEELARRVLEAPAAGEPRDTVSLSAFKISLPLPPPQLRIYSSRRLPYWVGGLFFDDETYLQAVRIDEIFLFGVPVDLGLEIGLEWKRAAREKGAEAFVIGFANDYVGYVLPMEYYEKRIRASFMSFNGPFMADFLDGFVKTVLSGYPGRPGSAVPKGPFKSKY